ncbi:MAG: bifunctional oligoribonuclease/PAP phosphatase NrnA [Lachnospiraceae bacterium]|nr:bifunctional oligoribonuclease/PAP phosphatase NrnA [Lachnospiraceae bacterium]
MKYVDEVIQDARRIAILGHVKPDGDCVGSCLALYHYIQDNYPEVQVKVYLGEFAEDFLRVLPDAGEISHSLSDEAACDLCFSLDASDPERLGEYVRYLNGAKRTVCIDHHITNEGFAQINRIDPKAAATAELLFLLMEFEKISKRTADCLYAGIVHDTGVFKHSNTTRRTMEAAGALLERGVRSNVIINDTFYHKSFVQNKILGKALMNATLELSEGCIFSALYEREIKEAGGTNLDLEGIIDQLRVTDGVRCAVFIHETGENVYKVSLRGNSEMDVSRIAGRFGGGGHVKAAGCTIPGSQSEVKEKLLDAIAESWRKG